MSNSNETLKKCCRCDFEKDLSEFNYRKDTQKHRNQGHGCFEKINKEFQTLNEDKIKIRRKKYSENIKNLKRLYDIDYRDRNREKIQLCKKNYFQNNKEELYKKSKNRKDEDNIFRLACN